jgi:flagellar motor switch protein FliN/FliY
MAEDTQDSQDQDEGAESGQEESTANGGATEEQGFEPEELAAQPAASATSPADVNLDLVLEVPVTVSLQVGSTDIAIRELVGLVEGSVVALERESTEPMDVIVNGKLIAHGEIVLVDENFGVRLTDVVSPAERIMNINQPA